MKSVLEAVTGHAHERGHSIALTDGRASLTYEALWRKTEEWAETLTAILPTNAPVGLCMDNCLSWVALELSLVKLRVPVVPIPLFFTEAQRRHALSESGAGMLLCDRSLPGYDCPNPVTIFGQTIFACPYTTASVELPWDTAKITYTSGTTDQSKGVCLSQSGLESVANAVLESVGREYAGIHCALLPLAVLLENVAGLYPTLLAGGCYHVPSLSTIGFGKSFSPDYSVLARSLRDCDATSAIVVPEILRGLSEALERDALALPSLKLLAVGGARISMQLLRRCERQHLPVFQGYGLTETASVVALNTPGHNRLGSVGRPLPGTRLELAADGEILIKRPALLGYLGQGPASDVLPTGDLGRLDKDGYLFIDGRKTNVIITAFGRNVAPEWVESELLSRAEIAQTMVFGDAAPALGALIVPAVGVNDVEISTAVARTNLTLPEYAVIKHWTRVAPFTVANRQLTGNGRIRRATIAHDFARLMAACLEQPGQYVTFFDALVAATAPDRAVMLSAPQIRDGLAGRISRSTYLHYLAEAFYHVRHTVSLMRLAFDRSLPDQEWLREALVQYIAEETGHEEWILEDIAQAGGNAETVRNGVPRFATEMMVAYAYDYVGRINPVGFLGMVFVLESTSEQLATRGARALMQALELPQTCFRYLLSHGSVDVDHLRFLQNLMSRVAEPRDRAAITHMAKAIYRLYGDVFRSIPHTPENSHVA
jgi:long-chain acyl-CoA synthetase